MLTVDLQAPEHRRNLIIVTGFGGLDRGLLRAALFVSGGSLGAISLGAHLRVDRCSRPGCRSVSDLRGTARVGLCVFGVLRKTAPRTLGGCRRSLVDAGEVG